MVLEVDVLHQVSLELFEPQVEGAPSRAGRRRRHVVVSKSAKSCEVRAVLLVLVLHDLDRAGCVAAVAGGEHREQDLLLLLHVPFELVGAEL